MVADDHPLVRGALVDLFAATGDISVVAVCEDGAEVLAAAERTRPDVVLLDQCMPRATGLEATRALTAAGLPSRVVLLTGSFSPASVREAHACGAVGYLLKEDDPGQLPQRVRDVAAGGTAWSAPAAASLLDSA
ncbi:response regulator [Modestobacter sp. URMC 112]